MKSKIFYRWCFGLWLTLLLILTSYPKISIFNDKILNIDKLAHFTVYFVLSFFIYMMNYDKSYQQNRRLLFWTMLIMPLLDELHQIPIPGRYFSYYDLIADFLGIIGIILIFRSKKIRDFLYTIFLLSEK